MLMERFIEILKYIFLGFLQGISEILPISSSGHLMVAQHLLKVNESAIATFTIFLHFASLLALLIFFRKLIYRIISGSFQYLFYKNKDRKDDFLLLLYIIIASIPIGVIGILFQDSIESLFSNLLFVGFSFLFTAFVLFIISFLKEGNKEKVDLKAAIYTGFAQLIGIFPGVSRSGMTLSGAKCASLKQEKAKEFAFLLFIPAALGSFIFSLDDAKYLFQDSQMVILSMIAMIVAFIFTLLSLTFIFKKFNNKHYRYFAIYLVFIGVFTIFIDI